MPLYFGLLTVTLLFLVDFLHFLYQWKQEKILYNLLTYRLDNVINVLHCKVHITKLNNNTMK